MIAPRWQKVIRDILGQPSRSLLVIVVLAAGVFEVGALLYKYALMEPVLGSMYGDTQPATAILTTDASDDSLVARVRRVPGVGDAEARTVILARVRSGNREWIPALFYAVRDMEHQRMDRFTSDHGAWPPAAAEMLLDRTALQVAGVAVGDSLTVRTPDGTQQTVRISGTAYAPGLAPAWMEHMVPGFVTWDSPLRRSAAGVSQEIRIRVSSHALDEGHAREVADSVQAMLEREGHAVTRVTVPTPGRHPHADQMDAFLYLLAAFAVVGFLLSSMLTANIMNALLAEQVRQIGVLKAIGASTRQVAMLYLSQVGMLAAASLVLSVPLAILVGGAYAKFSGTILNADVTHAPFPIWSIVVLVGLGILVPIGFALIPVLRAARLDVREALAGDLGVRPFGTRRFDRWWMQLQGIPRPLLLTLRSAMLRRRRLALTVVALALGGGSFMSALNLSDAWIRGVEGDFARRRFDLTATFASAQSISRIDSLLAEAPGVTTAEYWPESSAFLVSEDGVPGDRVSLLGAQPEGVLDLRVLAGRGLSRSDTTAAVVNQAILVKHPTLHVGGTVRLRVRGRTVSLPVVGIVRELTPMPAVYAPPAAVLAVTGRDGRSTRAARIVLSNHDDASQRTTAAGLESRFAAAGIEVTGMHRMLDQKQGILDHLVIILTSITMATVLVVVVGALGLTSTLALSVVQRTREIGVLGAIGASRGTIAWLIWCEGMFMGLLSWLVAMVLAVPLTWLLETTCGRIFFKTPLDFSVSPWASLVWLGLVVVLATLGSLQPAIRASALPVKEALAHV